MKTRPANFLILCMQSNSHLKDMIKAWEKDQAKRQQMPSTSQKKATKKAA